MNIVEAVIACMPYFKQTIREDVALAVFDREKILHWENGEFHKFEFRPGHPLDEATANFGPLGGKKEAVLSRISAEYIGVPFDALTIPIKDETGEIVALMSVNYSMENQATLEKLMNETDGIISGLLGGIQQVAAHSEELSATSGQILRNSQQTAKDSDSVTGIAGFIREISSQTNLLGLNAAIEAARVGEAGAGFGIVASEVRKLSQKTKEATTQIEDSLSTVRNAIKQMESEVSEISVASDNQAELVNEFMSSIEQLNETSTKLREFMMKLITYGAK